MISFYFKISISILFYISCSNILSAQTGKTFYIGHSLSDQIPDMVQSLSDDHAEVSFDWIYQSIPGSPLRWQWDRKDAMDYDPIDPHYYGFYDDTHGLPSGDFEVLVLTESVPRYEAIIDETYAYADSFYRYATLHNPDIQVYLYEDWHCILSVIPTGCDYDVDSNPWRQRLSDDLAMWESVVDSLKARYAPSTPVCLIPAGQGLAALYDSIQVGAVPDISDITDIFSDNIHLNDIGKYYVACIHFAMIHRASPVGLTRHLQYWWGGDFEAPSADLAMKFQEMAWETMQNYPNTCLELITTSTDVLLEESSICLMPNPTDSIFEIEGLIGSYTIHILDSSGRIHQTLSSSGDRIEIDLLTLPAGLYFIRIENNISHQLIIEKILKQD